MPRSTSTLTAGALVLVASAVLAGTATAAGPAAPLPVPAAPSTPTFSAGHLVPGPLIGEPAPVMRPAPPRRSSNLVGPVAPGSVRTLAATGPVTSTWQVTYDTGFTAVPKAQEAFARAVDTWSRRVTSTVPIVVNASFAALNAGATPSTTRYVLGQAGASYLVAGTKGTTQSYYAVALANAISGQDFAPPPVGGNGPDITAQFANDYPSFWYGPGPAPAGTVDFESVVLHELGHGLGFFGSPLYDTKGTATTTDDTGAYGVDPTGTAPTNAGNVPVIFDRFVATGGGTAFTSEPQDSPVTAAALRGEAGGLFFAGPQANAVLGSSPRLYTPPAYQPGSTYSHFDEATYPAASGNALMTPQLSSGETEHEPGPLTLAVMRDIGWRTSAPPVDVAPTPVVPEAPLAALLPVGGLALAGVALRRRRRLTAAA